MIKLMTIVGTRPEIIRLSVTLEKFSRYFDHTLVHTGQNYDYELNQIFFEDLDLVVPNFYLDAAGADYAETIGNIFKKSLKILREVRPDAIAILGDTNSALVAYIAKREGIPVFHMEAGNRCFNDQVPEEINRRIVDHVADVHLTYTDLSREYLLREGVDPQTVIKTGSPMAEVLERYEERILASRVLLNLSLESGGYILFSCHREENVDSSSNLKAMVAVLDWLSEHYHMPIIFSMHPRTRAKFDRGEYLLPRGTLVCRPFKFSDYVRLQLGAKIVLSDSGALTEESAIMRFPAINLRASHERPEGMEKGAVPLCGFDIDKIRIAIKIIENNDHVRRSTFEPPADYISKDFSSVVVNAILSYFRGTSHVKYRAK